MSDHIPLFQKLVDGLLCFPIFTVLIFLDADEEGMVLRWEGVMCGGSGDEGEATLEW